MAAVRCHSPGARLALVVHIKVIAHLHVTAWLGVLGWGWRLERHQYSATMAVAVVYLAGLLIWELS